MSNDANGLHTTQRTYVNIIWLSKSVYHVIEYTMFRKHAMHVHEGRIYVTGGVGSAQGAFLNTSEVFDGNRYSRIICKNNM